MFHLGAGITWVVFECHVRTIYANSYPHTHCPRLNLAADQVHMQQESLCRPPPQPALQYLFSLFYTIKFTSEKCLLDYVCTIL